MPPSPPVPVSALFTFTNGNVGTLVITFDQPLEPGATAALNWRFTSEGLTVMTGSAPGVIAGSTVTIAMAATAPPVGDPNSHDFASAPADVKGLTGIPAIAYTNFPTVIS